MKLSLKLSLGLTVLILMLAGLLFWDRGAQLKQLERTQEDITALHAELAERDRQEAERTQQDRLARAGQAAADAAGQAAALLDAFVRDKEAELNDRKLLRQLVSGLKGQRDAAAALLAKSKQPLDQVVVTDVRGWVTAVAPPNEALLGQAYLKPEELKLMRTRAAPRFKQKILPEGPGRALSVAARFRGGPKRTFKGVIVATVALEHLLKPATEGDIAADGEVRLLIVDRRGDMVLAPSPDLVGNPFQGSPEFQPLVAVGEGVNVEVKYNLGRWQAVKLGGPLGMTVVGLASVPTVSLPAGGVGGGGELSRAGIPVLLLGGAVVLVLVLAIVLTVLPLNRVKGLTQVAQAQVAGAAAVEVKNAGAKDEIGELARALEKLSDQLTEERRQREGAGLLAEQAQRDLTRSQNEAREQTEYQKNLETRARGEREALEGELKGVRTELEGLRTQLAARDAAVTERDQSLATLKAQLEQVQTELASLKQSLAQQAAELADARSELERRAAAPVAGFTLLSEASEALSVELSALLDLVQGYVGQIIESAGGAISGEQQEFLTFVINHSARSQRMLGDLRDFSNISKSGGLAMEPVDLVALLQDVVTTIQQVAEDKGLSFAAEIPASLPEGKGDEPRLRQLLTVILQNAVRFTPEGGRVSLSVVQKDSTVGIKIEDGADPIPLKSGEVFEHFHSADEETLELRGSGLRYPILRAIAELHGGGVDLAINEQGGNLFFIRLPVRADAPSGQETAEMFGAAAPVPSLDALEGAPLEPEAAPSSFEAAPPSLEAAPELPSLDTLEAAPLSLEASPTGEPVPPEVKPAAPPPPSFTFDSDEIIQE